MNKENVTIHVDEQILGKKQRTTIENAAIELCKKVEMNKEILKSVWPLLDEFDLSMAPSLELRPLDRIGSEPGESGIKVLSGRFNVKIKNIKPPIPSKQLIVKISPDTDDVERSFAEKNTKNFSMNVNYHKKLENTLMRLISLYHLNFIMIKKLKWLFFGHHVIVLIPITTVKKQQVIGSMAK